MLSPKHAAFEHFSVDLRQAMSIANREAKWRFCPLIETGHLLVAMTREPTGLARHLMARHGLHARSIRRAVYSELGRGSHLQITGKLDLSARLWEAIGHAIDHAQEHGHASVGTGGVLLGMIQTDAASRRHFSAAGVDVARFGNQLARYLERFMVEAPGQPLSLD